MNICLYDVQHPLTKCSDYISLCETFSAVGFDFFLTNISPFFFAAGSMQAP